MVSSFGFLLPMPCPTLKQFLVLAQKKGFILEGICERDTGKKKKKKTPSQIPHSKGKEGFSRQVCIFFFHLFLLFKASMYPKRAVGLAC